MNLNQTNCGLPIHDQTGKALVWFHGCRNGTFAIYKEADDRTFQPFNFATVPTFSPERTDSDAWTHLEAFRVLEVREERLREVAFLGGYHHDSGLSSESSQGLQFAELRPVADLVIDGPQIEGKRPGVFRRQGDGDEEVLSLEFRV